MERMFETKDRRAVGLAFSMEGRRRLGVCVYHAENVVVLIELSASNIAE